MDNSFVILILVLQLVGLLLLSLGKLSSSREIKKLQESADYHYQRELAWQQEYYRLRSSDAIKSNYEIRLSFETVGEKDCIRKVSALEAIQKGEPQQGRFL